MKQIVLLLCLLKMQVYCNLFHHSRYSRIAAIIEVRSIPIPDLNNLDESRTESSTLLVRGIAPLVEDADNPSVVEASLES